MKVVQKDPGATLDFAIDWSAELTATGDSITTSSWTAEPGITIATTPAPSHAGGKTVVWLTGGAAGAAYRVVNRIVTTGGRTDERTLLVHVTDR